MIVAGTRRILQVIDRPSPGGSAGIGIDVTESEAMRAELARMTEAHRRTLDQLSTAVAIFRADQRLTFYNAAFRELWGLEPAFLDSEPTNSAVLDRLRTARKLPEQADFRKWKSRAARGLSRDRAAPARMVSAGRAHAARRHHAEPGGRRHLPVRRRHRAAQAGAPLRGADRRAGRDARSAHRRRRGVRQRRAARPAQSGLRAAVAPRFEQRSTARIRPSARTSRPCWLVRAALRRRARSGRGCAAPSPALERARADPRRGSNARRQRARLHHRAAARRRHAGDVPGRHQLGQCRARADRARRRAAGCRPAQERSSCSTCPTSCARRSPTSSASRICCSIR